ncbi:hypothetical protein ABZ614_40170 [Streptomyces sp. NPDC013178]|uniref:hypothetical protein n=1 Tax=Streptomyces sp. NPDC013178 TaxID=3155118 RepID=UPI0033C9B9BF
MKNDYLKWGALVAALVATASAEYELARAVGFNQWVAAAVPAALDLYTVRALRAHREVLAAVAAMIGVNAASHLVTTGLLPVNVWLVVAVAAIAPLVLWRVHSLGDDQGEALDVIQTLPAAEVTDDRGDTPTVADLHGAEGYAGVTETVTAAEPVQVVIPAVPELESGTFWDDHKSSDLYTKLTAAVPAEQSRQVVTEVVTLSPSELRRRARSLNRQAVTSTNRPVTIKTLQDELGLSRREATELRREIVGARS